MHGALLTLVIPPPAVSLEDDLRRRISPTTDSPSFILRVVLGEYRRRGVAFDRAWSSAIRSLPRPPAGSLAAAEMDEWKLALKEAKPAYRAAYTGEALELAGVVPVALEGLSLRVGAAA